jgi:hydroxypyruvate isomerase
MRAIAATGYTGFVGHEYVPAHDAAQSLIASRRLLNVE